MKRSFRVFAEKDDLVNVFNLYQSLLSIYYAPAYSDIGHITIDDITTLKDIGINHNGSHIGNNSFSIFKNDHICAWKDYQCYSDKNNVIIRSTTLCNENKKRVTIELGGIYNKTTIFPTTISTISYEDTNVKKLFNELKKAFRKNSIKIQNGYIICSSAFKNRYKYRFCTIDIKSPSEYDLNIE